jgi:type II secretory pathway pseudopilin PulG
MLLIIALLAIAAATVVTSLTFDIKRDREEEMIHRGTQYSRAIRAYYKKFGRYPTKLEDLESANNMRFLRKRYKDPLTGQDFKLLHFGDVKLTLTGGFGGGSIPGANPLNGQPNQPGGFAPSPSSSFGGNNSYGTSNSSFGQNQQPKSDSTSGSDPSQPNASGQPGQGDASSSDSTNKDSASGDKLAGVTFGGGPIVGVASGSKKDTIREFNHKKKYNEWQFVYDPAMDRGGLIRTPYQPQLAGFGQQPNLNGQPQPASGFGNSGQPPAGMQNNPNLPSGGLGNPQVQDSPQQ